MRPPNPQEQNYFSMPASPWQTCRQLLTRLQPEQVKKCPKALNTPHLKWNTLRIENPPFPESNMAAHSPYLTLAFSVVVGLSQDEKKKCHVL